MYRFAISIKFKLEICYSYFSTEHELADILTKPLPPVRFLEVLDKIKVIDGPHKVNGSEIDSDSNCK